jgi:glycosyltransferase involved in cell wall biosynthesis
VIEALGRDPELAARVRYLVVGPCSDAHRRELESIVAEHHLESVVELRGRVSDEELADTLARSDICINLRQPCIEAASASLGEQMWYGKPVVVSDAGCYAELPDDCVIKIDPGDPAAGVAAALHRLVDDPALGVAIGEHATAYAHEHFRSDRYARRVFEFIDEVLASRPFLEVADTFGHHLSQLGIDGDMPVVDVTASVVHELFAGAAPLGSGHARARH